MRNDNVKRIDPTKNYTRNVYARILDFFKNLKRLSINQAFISSHRVLSLHDLPSNTFFSSTLTHLCINVANFDDCLYLLDGRLKQLTTLIVRAFAMVNYSSIAQNMVNSSFIFFYLVYELLVRVFYSIKVYVFINISFYNIG